MKRLSKYTRDRRNAKRGYTGKPGHSTNRNQGTSGCSSQGTGGNFCGTVKNFEKLFDMLNEGFSRDDDKEINVALSLITEQIKQSPMKQAVQLMQDINNPNAHEIEF
jgi:hypothetical protein